MRVPPTATAPLVDDLRTAWTIVLRNQFHDVLAGSAIAAVYADVHAEYDRAERIVERLAAGARGDLPRSDRLGSGPMRRSPASSKTLPFSPTSSSARG